MGNVNIRPHPGNWIFCPLPGVHKGMGTYHTVPVDRLPPIEIDPEVKDIVTVDDFFNNLERMTEFIGDSPTACYVLEPSDKPYFYCDQQGCIVWKVGSDSKVYGSWKDSNDEESGNFIANSLPEFLTRMRLDNMSWYALHAMDEKEDVDDMEEGPLKRHLKAYFALPALDTSEYHEQQEDDPDEGPDEEDLDESDRVEEIDSEE